MPNTSNPSDYCDAVYLAPDGAVVLHNARGDYDYSAICAWAAEHPDQVQPMPVNLDDLKTSLCDRIEARKPGIMRSGFDYPGGRVQGDDEAQSNLMAWVLLDSKGLLTYPRAWRRSDNTFLPLATSSDLEALAGAMAAFKDTAYFGIFTAKDGIRSATTATEAQGIFDAWEAGL